MGNKNSGRRPAPTALKILRGIPGKRRLNHREPVPPKGAVVMPVNVSSAAAAVWAELAPLALAMGTLTRSDVRAFATLCELQATLQHASAQKSLEGFAMFALVEDGATGAVTVVVHAAIKVEQAAAAAVRPFYELFGLTPVARARIAVPAAPAAKAVSKWAGALA